YHNLLRYAGHTFQAEHGALYTFMHLAEHVEPDILRKVNQQTIEFLHVLQRLQQNIGMPQGFESIGERDCPRFMKVDHFRQLLSLAVTRYRRHRINVDQTYWILSRDIGYLILRLYRRPCIGLHSQSGKTAC